MQPFLILLKQLLLPYFGKFRTMESVISVSNSVLSVSAIKTWLNFLWTGVLAFTVVLTPSPSPLTPMVSLCELVFVRYKILNQQVLQQQERFWIYQLFHYHNAHHEFFYGCSGCANISSSITKVSTTGGCIYLSVRLPSLFITSSRYFTKSDFALGFLMVPYWERGDW